MCDRGDGMCCWWACWDLKTLSKTGLHATQTREAGKLRLVKAHRKFFSPFSPDKQFLWIQIPPLHDLNHSHSRHAQHRISVSCLRLDWKYTPLSLSVFVQAAGQRLSDPQSSSHRQEGGRGGRYRSIYIRSRLEHGPLNQQSEEPNLSDTDVSKRRIHTRIFQGLVVSFSSFHFIFTSPS